MFSPDLAIGCMAVKYSFRRKYELVGVYLSAVIESYRAVWNLNNRFAAAAISCFQ
jgi:hypothetical protein